MARLSAAALSVAITVLVSASARAEMDFAEAQRTAKKLAGKSVEERDQALAKLPSDKQYAIRRLLPCGKTDHLKTADIEISGPMATVGPGAPNVKGWSELSEDVKVACKDLERVIGISNRLPIGYLEGGASRQRAVGRVIFKAKHKTKYKIFNVAEAWGTGFLVSKSLLMTNNHVIPTKSFAEDKVRIQFNFQHAADGKDLEPREFDLDPGDFFRTNSDLDYTLVRVCPRREAVEKPEAPERDIVAGDEWGYLAIQAKPLLFLPEEEGDLRQRLTIIQHPQGERKQVALHDNFIVKLSTKFVKYTTDTEQGSSGSPVFNSFWELTALHRAGGDKKKVEGVIVWLNNMGTRMDVIAADLQMALKEDHPAILEELGLEVSDP